jgi:hypothetical protein
VGLAVFIGLLAFVPAGGQGSAATSAAPDQSDEWPVTECGTTTGRGCAPSTDRVDLERPTFSDPTNITNPLFPVSTVDSVIQVGIVDGLPFRSETTTLAETGMVDWYGEKVEVVRSQYAAYLDGAITEVAIDRYAQADDGSVWYFGEDVIDYRGGSAYFTEGTWLAGRDGPPAMVMPAKPQLGDVFRVENVIGIVFEELTVVEVDKTVAGPNGPVSGAIVVDELGVTGGHSLKTLAPGYGEFLTRNGRELEAMAVATPTDALPGGAPLALRKALTAAWGTTEYVRAMDWSTAVRSVERIGAQLADLSTTQQPPRLSRLARGSLRALEAAVREHQPGRAEAETIKVAQSLIDLEARYLSAREIEVARLHLHAQGLRASAASHRGGAVLGEVAAMEWTRQRISLPGAAGEQVDRELSALRAAAGSRAWGSAADIAVRLASMVRDSSA